MQNQGPTRNGRAVIGNPRHAEPYGRRRWLVDIVPQGGEAPETTQRSIARVVFVLAVAAGCASDETAKALDNVDGSCLSRFEPGDVIKATYSSNIGDDPSDSPRPMVATLDVMSATAQHIDDAVIELKSLDPPGSCRVSWTDSGYVVDRGSARGTCDDLSADQALQFVRYLDLVQTAPAELRALTRGATGPVPMPDALAWSLSGLAPGVVVTHGRARVRPTAAGQEDPVDTFEVTMVVGARKPGHQASGYVTIDDRCRLRQLELDMAAAPPDERHGMVSVSFGFSH